MPNENYNNTGDWRSKLDALDNLPGENKIDKDASWERVHDRLRRKKDRKRVIWYWPAAACLIFVLMIQVINPNKRGRVQVEATAAQKPAATKSSSSVLADKKNSVEIAPLLPLEKNHYGVVTDKNIKKYEVLSPGVPQKNQVSVPVSNAVVPEEAATTVLQPLDTSLSITAAQPVNKKLRVVHINELGDPVEESPGMARSADIHSFRMKFANQEVYINSAVASRANILPVLKSKTSPN